MRRRPWVLTVLVLLWTPLAGVATPAGAQAPSPPAVPAKAFVLVDADSGRVLAGRDHHDPLPPASTTKLMTALVAVEKLPLRAVFVVGEVAAAQPAMRIGMQMGQGWALRPALHSLLMVSANDAAYALAEAASGSLEAFAADMNAAAERYGMRDSVFNDPAGFDDAASFNGGSRVSAYDLAIAARNVLAIPELAAIAALPEYRFTGPGREHRLVNHNRLLTLYPGAIGLKTGYTRRAGRTFVGAAHRDGRTMIAVVLNSDDIYGGASALLDHGFATPPEVRGTGERLPDVSVRPYRVEPISAAAQAAGAASGEGRRTWRHPLALTLVASTGGVVSLRRRRARRRRQRQRAERRRRLAEASRRELSWVTEGRDAGGPPEPARQLEML